MLFARSARLVVTALSLAALGGCTWQTEPEPAPKQTAPAVDTSGPTVQPALSDDDTEANSEKIKRKQ